MQSSDFIPPSHPTPPPTPQKKIKMGDEKNMYTELQVVRFENLRFFFFFFFFFLTPTFKNSK